MADAGTNQVQRADPIRARERDPLTTGPYHETYAHWRLFTKADLDETFEGLTPPDAVSPRVNGGSDSASRARVNATDTALVGALRAVGRHVRKLGFEHGKEGKVPRANTYRPYRLLLTGRLAAVLVLRASEAFNVCEIDVFLTAEFPGLRPLETTRAALLFAMSDAIKNGGSLALQFTRACAPHGLPQHVRAVAAQAGVALQYADRGTLSPEEVRALLLRFSGLSEDGQARASEYAARRFFTTERVCQLVASGVWSADEVNCLLLCCPCPELVLGLGIDPTQRLASAHAVTAGQFALLNSIFSRALRYVPPRVQDQVLLERNQYLKIPQKIDPVRLAVHHGPLPAAATLRGWAGRGDERLALPKDSELVLLPRPRAREEIRLFLRHDLDQAHEVARTFRKPVVLAYPSDYRGLADDERREAEQAAARRGVSLLACPQTGADLEAEFWQRQRKGRTIRP